MYGLLGLAVLIALFSIANSMSLSIHERTRELGLLRAVGMTRHQTRHAVRWEAALVALLGTGLGVLVGVFFGWSISVTIRDDGLAAFTVPVGSLVVDRRASASSAASSPPSARPGEPPASTSSAPSPPNERSTMSGSEPYAGAVETHCGVVLFIGDRAYKLKKPVAFAFVDFSTVAARRRACEARSPSTAGSPPRRISASVSSSIPAAT